MRLLMAGCVVGCITLGTACSEPDTLTCEWLAMADNCWKTTVMSAVSCLPPEADRGTLNPDNTACVYPMSGHLVTFTPALDLLGDDDPAQSFVVTDADDATCVRWQETSTGFTLTVNGNQTFRESTSGLALDVTCPDGTSFHNGNALDLFSCPTGLSSFPGESAGWTDTSISQGFIGVDPPVPVYDCAKL
jgi:hypothetical protein